MLYFKWRKTYYRFRRERYNTTIIDSSPCQLSEEDVVLPVKFVIDVKIEKRLGVAFYFVNMWAFFT